MPVRNTLSVCALLAASLLAACGITSPSGHPAGGAPTSGNRPVAITRANARERCASASRSGAHLRVGKVVVTRLGSVRTWVTRGHDVDWHTFSADLSAAPLTETVAVCVVSHADGTLLSLPGDSRKSRSAAIIVSPTGSTSYAAGDALDMTALVSELKAR